MKSVLRLVLILAAALGVLSCREEAEVAAPSLKDTPEPRELVLIRRNPHMDEPHVQTIDVTWWEEGEDAVILYCSETDWVAIMPYPWSGEDTIIYNYDGNYLWIRTRPEDTTTYYSYCGYLVQGRIVGLSTSRYDEYSLSYEPENILCLGGVVDLDSLKRYPNVTTIGFSWAGVCGSYCPVRFSNIEQVPEDIDLYFWSSELRNHDFPKLKRLDNLKGLVIYVNPWANKALRHIGKMRNLRQLDIRYYCANDRKLRHLAKLKNLHTLTLTGIKISDCGLRHLAKVPSLRSLTLDSYQRHSYEEFRSWWNLSGSEPLLDSDLTLWDRLHFLFYDIIEFLEIFPYAFGSMFVRPTTAEGWQNFAELSVLEELTIHGVITDDDLRGIGQIKSLRRLDQIGGNITDEGIKCLVNLTKLCDLNLTSTGITDASLPLLMKLTSLKRLNVSYTLITAEGAARLQEALPDCDVVWAKRR